GRTGRGTARRAPTSWYAGGTMRNGSPSSARIWYRRGEVEARTSVKAGRYPMAARIRSTSWEFVARNICERTSAALKNPVQYQPRCLRMAANRGAPPSDSKYRACSRATWNRSGREISHTGAAHAEQFACALAHSFARKTQGLPRAP